MTDVTGVPPLEERLRRIRQLVREGEKPPLPEAKELQQQNISLSFQDLRHLPDAEFLRRVRGISQVIFENPVKAFQDIVALNKPGYLKIVLPDMLLRLSFSPNPDERLANLRGYVDAVAGFIAEVNGRTLEPKERDTNRLAVLADVSMGAGEDFDQSLKKFDAVTHSRTVSEVLPAVFRGGVRMYRGFVEVLNRDPDYILTWLDSQPESDFRGHLMRRKNLSRTLNQIGEFDSYLQTLDEIRLETQPNRQGRRPFEGLTLYPAGGADRAPLQAVSETGGRIIQSVYNPHEAWFTAWDMLCNGLNPDEFFGRFIEGRPYITPLSGLTLTYPRGIKRINGGVGLPLGEPPIKTGNTMAYSWENITFLGGDALTVGRGSTIEQFLRDAGLGRVDNIYLHDSEAWLFEKPQERGSGASAWPEREYDRWFNSLVDLLGNGGFFIVSLNDERTLRKLQSDSRFHDVTPAALADREPYHGYPRRVYVDRPDSVRPFPLNVGGENVLPPSTPYPGDVPKIAVSFESDFRVFMKKEG